MSGLAKNMIVFPYNNLEEYYNNKNALKMTKKKVVKLDEGCFKTA